MQERLKQTYNSKSKAIGAPKKSKREFVKPGVDSNLSAKRLVPILRNRNSSNSPIKSHEPVESPRAAAANAGADPSKTDDSNLPEVNKTLISYKTSKNQGSRRPWLDPDYIKVGRSVRIQNQNSRETEQS